MESPGIVHFTLDDRGDWRSPCVKGEQILQLRSEPGGHDERDEYACVVFRLSKGGPGLQR